MNARRGLMLIDMMIALVLFTAFGFIASMLFDSILDIADGFHGTKRPDRRRAAVVERMRADAWGAMELRVVREREWIARLPDGRSVFWKLLDDTPALRRTEVRQVKVGDVTRVDQLGEESWEVDGGSLPERFEKFGPGVRVHWLNRTEQGEPVIDLYSEVVALTGVAR